jgi:hypothetical protein
MLGSLNTYLTRVLGPVFVALVVAACGGGSSNGSEPAQLVAVDAEGSTSIDATVLAATLASLPLEPLSTAEADGVVFMREEEKLARDVYMTLFERWGQRVFDNISRAEQIHMDAVAVIIERYGLTDPVGSNGVGVFTNPTLQGLYDTLVSQGEASRIDALIVGATIEEIDIVDLQNQLDSVVDNQDIALVYGDLMKGSRNHLRAFVRNLEKLGMSYTPQYLPQDEYDAIIGSPMETGPA